MPDNILKVDLQVDNSAKATADVTAFKNTIVDTGKAATQTANSADAAINKIAAATQSAQQAQAAPFSPAHADIEKQLTADHFKATAERLAASRAADAAEVASAGDAAGKIKAVRGFGAIFRATGLTALGINEAELNAGIALVNKFGTSLTGAAAASEAVAAAQATATATAETLAVAQGNAAISAAALAGAEEAATVAASELAAAEAAAAVGFAPIVAGVAIVAAAAIAAELIFGGIAKNAEVRLKQEQKISEEYGKQQTMLADIRKQQFDFAQQRQKDADAAELTKTLAGPTAENKVIGTDDRAALDDKRKALEASLALDEAYWKKHVETAGSVTAAESQAALKGFKEKEDIIRQYDARLRSYDDQRAKAEQESFDKRFEDSKKNEADKAEFEKKILQERLQSVNAAREKINEIGQSADALFAGLFAAAGSDNPFVKVFDDAEKAIERTTEATKNLSKELQKQAADMTAAANEKGLFSARIDNAVNAANLLSDADRFRPADSRLVKRDENGNLVSSATGETVSEKLARQLAAVNKIPATTDADKAIADRKIIALTQGLKPEDLTDAQRETAAKARENEAQRLTTAETDAKEQRAVEAQTQVRIDKNIAELLKIAQKDGLTGVIRIINEAEDRARESLGKRPRIGPETAADLMQQ